jgi:hypothetical protein
MPLIENITTIGWMLPHTVNTLVTVTLDTINMPDTAPPCLNSDFAFASY